jgi:hypothetical protein
MNTKVATGGRQHRSKPPEVAGSSHAREQYREQSIIHSPSSDSPSPSNRSRTESGSKSRSPSPATVPAHIASQLVPLEYLQNVTSPRREPADEQLLRKFSTHSVSPTVTVVPRCGQSPKPQLCASPALPLGQSAARHARSRHAASWDTNARSR